MVTPKDPADTPLPAYQEGNVESVGERPGGADTEDRTGQPPPSGRSAETPPRPAEGFVSQDVQEKASREDPRSSRTRG